MMAALRTITIQRVVCLTNKFLFASFLFSFFSMATLLQLGVFVNGILVHFSSVVSHFMFSILTQLCQLRLYRI